MERLFHPTRPPVRPDTDDPAKLDFYKFRLARYNPSPAMKLVLDLGFSSFNFSHSPGGGAPETLIGKQAPDFDLERLADGRLELSKFIEGKPALITFWGLACGPCRREAPHLTRLWRKYESQGFTIVAVNGYNDKRDAVAKYVTRAKLNHPIVLKGGSVADNKFKVGAYPTTFWVDHRGIVVDYDVGFSSAKRVETRIKQLLDAASK